MVGSPINDDLRSPRLLKRLMLFWFTKYLPFQSKSVQMTENTTITKTELLKHWFVQIWEKGNLDAIDKMLGPNAESNGLFPAFGLRSADYHDLALAIRGLVEDIHVDFSHALEQGEWLAVRTVVDGKRADNGDPVHVSGQVFVRFEGLRMAEIYSHFDFFSFFEQMGQLPADALPICLTGQRLRWE